MGSEEESSAFAHGLIVLALILAIGGFALHDWDGDSLRNYQEWTGSTAWRNPDTDGDGGLDGEEVNLFGTDPTVPQETYKVSKFLRSDGFSQTEINYMKEMLEDPEFRSLAFEIAPHQDGRITEEEIDYLSSAKENTSVALELGLNSDGKITPTDIDYLNLLLENPLDIRPKALDAGFHEDGRINQAEFDYWKKISEDNEFRSIASRANLHSNREITGTEIKYLDLLAKNPGNTKFQIFDAGFHQDAKITQEELSLAQDSDGDGRIDYLEEKFPTVSYALEKGLSKQIAENLRPLDEDGTMSKLEKNYVNLLKENTHNLRPQILDAGLHQDGEITENDLSLAKDADKDGLIDYMERKIGTDPQNKDTDKDQLLDGWEVYGVKRPSHRSIPLREYGADPLHKDLFVEVISENDLKLSRGAKEKIVQIFNDAPVSNPDGSEGIDIHIDDDTPGYSLGGENPDLDKYREDIVDGEHSRYGTFHFARLKGSYSGAGVSTPSGCNFLIGWKMLDGGEHQQVLVFNHELGHNILGKLDPSNQENDSFHTKFDKFHSKYESYLMYPSGTNVTNPTYHPNVWQEIDRDGLRGLPGPNGLGKRIDWEIAYSKK